MYFLRSCFDWFLYWELLRATPRATNSVCCAKYWNLRMNTRSKALKEKETNLDDSWDFPGLKRNTMKKSSILKTYSKKTPYHVVYRQHIEKEDLFSEPEQKTGNHFPSASASKRKWKRPSKKVNTRMSSCKKKNKTTVSLASMSPCTVLNFTDNDGDGIGQPMSLCSIANRIDEISCGMTARNSTLLANNDDDVDINFVPDNISVIQDERADNQTIVSNYNEWTPVKQVIENVKSLKKVTFCNGKVGQKSKINHFSKPTDADIQSILKKPYSASDSIENLECYRDITPEASNSIKTCGSQRRRLSYLQEDDAVPVCIILDLPCSKGKRAAVLHGKSADLIKLEELNSFPTDILL